MIFPVNYIAITQTFSNKHKGIDLGYFSSDHHNQDILSVDKGYVIYIGYQNTGGYVIHIRHDSGYVSEYGHLRSNSIKVIMGQYVKKGQVIAQMGQSGKVTGEHLHFGLYKGKTINYNKNNWVNPLKYLCKMKNQVANTKSLKIGIYTSKIVSELKSPPLNVRDKSNNIVEQYDSNEEIPYNGNTGLTKFYVDRSRNYTSYRKYINE